MVCHGNDPPEHDPHELKPPAEHELIMGMADDSDDENDYIGYEPLPQGPEMAPLAGNDLDDSGNPIIQTTFHVPRMERLSETLAREVWNAPRPADPIQMDSETAEQVMQAMANFALPQESIPEWAQTISEEEWKQTLINQIEKLKTNNS